MRALAFIAQMGAAPDYAGDVAAAALAFLSPQFPGLGGLTWAWLCPQHIFLFYNSFISLSFEFS